jgi:hypothetical protein
MTQDPFSLTRHGASFQLTTPVEVSIARDWLLDENRIEDADRLSDASIRFFTEMVLHAVRLRWQLDRREKADWFSAQDRVNARTLHNQLLYSLNRALRSLRNRTRLLHLEASATLLRAMLEHRVKHTGTADSSVARFRLRYGADMLDGLVLLARAGLESKPCKKTRRQRS